MRSKIFYGLWIAIVALVFAVPAYAYSGTANGNGGLGNGMGTGTHGMHDGISIQSNDGAARNDVSVYGTGTGSQFLNVNTNGTSDRNPAYRTESSYTNGGYRALETASSKGMNWGWLGLLGLIGLVGMRGRNPQRNR